MKLMVGCNLLTSVQTLAYYPHMNFWYGLGKNHPDWTVLANMPRRYSIDRMRNDTAKIAMEEDCDWILFYDDDVMFSPTVVDKLLETPGEIKGGLTLIRGYPFRPMAFKWEDNRLVSYDDYKDHVDENGILPVAALGFSLVMISVPLLKKMEPPYFMTGTNNTEDVYFCLRAKEQVPDCEININTEAVTQHILDSHYISPWNRDAFIDLEMKMDMKYESGKHREDRGAEYAERVMFRLRNKAIQE